MRNVISHEGIFDFRPHYLKILPVSWRGKKITKDMNKSALTSAFFDRLDAIKLHYDMRLFVEREIR